MVKLDEINSTSTFAWSHDCLPILAAGTVAGAVDINFNSSSSLELWDIFSPTNNKEPIFSAAVDNRFYSLAWSPSFDNRSHGILAAAFENGIIEFWDVATLIKSKDLSKASIFKSSKHSGAVRTLSFNPKQPHILVSGGSKGEIFIWDTKTFDEPTVPGTAMTPMDEITSVAWNNSVSHIMASTSNGGYTSIWDLKSKREVLHLSYSGELGRANFSYVAWHPTQSTKLITASDSDNCPLILTWDLRNSNAPEKVMKGHKKGVLSLDWCKQDPELLISSGKDNSTMLWNPITGEKLGEYPTTANWAFLTKFAPQAPDIFATASFDGKIIIQSLQDTSPPVSTNVTTNDDEFWNEISTTDTQQPTFDIKQAPAWLKRPSNVSFGFGSKLVTIKKDQDGKSSTVEIKKFVTKGNLQKDSEKISKAFESNDFSDIINERLNDERFINNVDKSDWQLLKKLSSNDKKILFTDAIKDDGDVDKSGKVEANGKSGLEDDVKDGNTESSTDNGAVDDSFFDKLGEANNDTSKSTSPIYVPTGEFKIFSSKSSDNDKKLIKLILNNKINEAVENCLENDKLTEALVLSLDSSNEVKDKVRNAFFNKSKDSEFARVLYSASSKNVTDLISNGNVEDWKLIANSISSFANDDEDFNNKITELGDRILTSNKNNRDDAILCYLAGGSIDKIANIWLKELPTLEKTLLEDANNKNISSPSDARFEALNNFAEKIVSYKSLSKITGALSGPSIEPICKVILEYVNLLAGFGQFEVADQFLKLLPDDFDGSKTEKDRISKATAKAVPAQTSKNLNSRAGARNTQYSRSNTATNNVNQANIPASPLNNGNIRPPVAPVNQFAQQQPITPGFRPIAPPAANNSTIAPPSSNGAHGLGNGASIGGAPVAPTANPYAKSSNPYAPSGHNSNPYMKPEPTVLSPPPNNLSINGNAPPPKPSYKQETDGWNDLPDTFKPKTAPRRAVGGGSVVSPSQTPFQSHSPAPPSISKRPSLASAPTTSSIPSSVPPKGPSRTASRANLTSPRQVHAQPRYPQPPSGPQTPSNPPVNNPYAPQVPPSTAAPVNNPYAPPPTAANTAPVNNPYAPPPTAANTAPVAPSIGAPAFSPAPGLPINSPRLSHAAPVKNPYAPPPASTSSATAGSGPQSRVSSGGIVPPPKTSIPPPPASGVSSISGPPLIGPSISNQPPAQSPSQPPPVTASKTQTKYPSGDRSHISAESLPIYEIFDSTYQALKPKIPERFVKHGEDMEKRLNILFDHLNNDDLLSKEAVEALKEVATSLKNKDYSNASSSILAFASSFPEEIGNWHVGVKRLVQMDEALV